MIEGNLLLNESFDGNYNKVDIDVFVFCVFVGIVYVV